MYIAQVAGMSLGIKLFLLEAKKHLLKSYNQKITDTK